MNKLLQLHRQLTAEYYSYRSGAITEKEYLKRAKPIDMEIGRLEMSTLQGTPAWREAFSQSTLKPVR